MSALLAAASHIQQVLQDSGEHFCFIGGLALQRWGEPRFTRDVDVTVLCPYGSEPACVDRLLGTFTGRINNARAFALEHRVLLLADPSGVPIDVALGAIPFEERCIARATLFNYGNAPLLTCSAEDLVVLKAFAGRDRDWADIESIAMRQSDLDWNAIFAELAPLARLRDEALITSRLEAIQKSAAG